MKKVTLVIIGILALITTSCGFESQEAPLTENLVTFTAPGKSNKDVKLGVKDKVSETIIVPAGEYVSFEADDKLIIGTDADVRNTVFLRDGSLLNEQKFTTFSRFPDAQDLYIGTIDEKAYLYFLGETTKEIITKQYIAGDKHLFVASDSSSYQVYDYTGNMLYESNTTPIWIIDETDTQSLYFGFENDAKRPNFTIYSAEKEDAVKIINKTRWQIVKQHLDKQPLDSIAVYVSVKNIKKL